MLLFGTPVRVIFQRLISLLICNEIITCNPTNSADCTSCSSYTLNVAQLGLRRRFLEQEKEVAFVNDGTRVCVCIYGVRKAKPPGTLISPITLERWGICLRIPHQMRPCASGGSCIYSPCSSRPAGVRRGLMSGRKNCSDQEGEDGRKKTDT